MVMTADQAYAEALRRARIVIRAGSEILNLSGLKGLERLPNEIGQYFGFDSVEPFALLSVDPYEFIPQVQLKQILLDDTSVSSLSVVKNIANLEVISAIGTEVSDISPLASQNGLRRVDLSWSAVSDLRPIATGSKPNLTCFAFENTPAA